MKITKKQLKQIIKEEIEKSNDDETLQYPKKGEGEVQFDDDTVLTYSDKGRLEKVEKPKENVMINIFPNGTKVWYKNGEVHRDGDKPAWISVGGAMVWYKNGDLHRDGDEPAVIWADGRKQWWVRGRKIRVEK